MKNENGYTLVLVMITITVTMVLGLALSGAVVTTSKQFTKTDNLNKATDLAEMGVTYYLNTIKNYISTANTKIDFCSEFKQLENNNQSIYSVQNVESNQFKITRTAQINCTNTNSFDIKFSSTGTTEKGELKELQGSFTISNDGKIVGERVGEVLPDMTSSQSKAFKFNGNVNINNNKDITYYTNTEYPNGISFMGTLSNNYKDDDGLVFEPDVYINDLDLKGNGKIRFKHNATIKLVTKMNSHTNLTIDNDAIFIFNRATFQWDPSNKSTICIRGNIYSVDTEASPQVLEDFSDFNLYFDNICSNANGKKIWGIDPNDGIVVDY